MAKKTLLEVIDPRESEDDLCRYKSLRSLLAAIKAHLFVPTDDASVVAIRSSSEPSPADRGKLWINPALPPSISTYASGEWRGNHPYPVGVATPWLLASAPPSYLTKLSDAQVTAYGLSELNSGSWVVYNPGSDSLA